MTGPFPRSSRYAGVSVAVWRQADGTEVPYLRRRFCPRPGAAEVLAVHRVAAHDRLDLVTARYLGDPELFWRLCDTAGALHPDELTARPDAVIVVALPEGG